MGNDLKNNRIRALVIGASLCTALIAFVFAFMQQAEAKRQAAIAIENERKVTECKLEALKLNQQLNDQTQTLQLTLQKIQLLAEQAAAKSKNKK